MTRHEGESIRELSRWCERKGEGGYLASHTLKTLIPRVMISLGRVTSVLKRARSPWSSSLNPLRRAVSGNGSRGRSTGEGDGRENERNSKPPSSLTQSSFEEDDEFTSIEAPSEIRVDEAVTPDAALRKLADAPQDIAPHLAKALVERIVEEVGQAVAPGTVVPLTFTRHTVRILRASRIVTHDVVAQAATVPFPIAAKVTARVDLDALGISVLARAALEEIAGPRLKDNVLTVNGTKYRTRAENQVHVVGLASRAIGQAMIAVGETVDETELKMWTDVAEVAKDLTSEDSSEVQAFVDVALALPEPGYVPGENGAVLPASDTARDYSVSGQSQKASM
jgi:hypothetical protein